MLPLFFVIIPVGSAFLIGLSGRGLRKFSNIFVSAVTGVLFFLSLNSLSLLSRRNIIVYKVSGWMPPAGITLVIDNLAALMLVAVNLIAFLVSIYALNYVKIYTGRWKFYALFVLMLAGLNGVVISGDLFNLYVFLEIASISGYALVAFGIEPEDLEASFKYAVMGALASTLILLGIALLYSHASTLNMADVSSVLSERPAGALIGFVSVLFLAGFGLKSALVPFHAWLPDAHSSAPTPVSAMLSGVFIKVLGVYALARVFFNVFGAASNVLYVLMVLGLLSMVIGGLLAVAQTDIKRMLAYSSISQIGYIIFALGIGTPLGVFGGLFHLFNHAIFKSLLFLDAGAVEYSTGTRDMRNLGGLNSKLPVVGYSNLLAAMNISGIPPLGGFWSKLIIIIAAVSAGHFAFAAIAVLVSIVTLIYYTKFQSQVFFGSFDDSHIKIKRIPSMMKISITVMALVCLVACFMILPYFRNFFLRAADSLLIGSGYKDVVFWEIKQ